MSIISELAAIPGVIAAGEYSYRGDRFTYEGHLDSEKARMASIMCRATTMGAHMQVSMMTKLAPECGCHPVRGWIIQGKEFSVCVISNIFCFIDNSHASINDIVGRLREKLGDKTPELI